jgi:hypothetical protein
MAPSTLVGERWPTVGWNAPDGRCAVPRATRDWPPRSPRRSELRRHGPAAQASGSKVTTWPDRGGRAGMVACPRMDRVSAVGAPRRMAAQVGRGLGGVAAVGAVPGSVQAGGVGPEPHATIGALAIGGLAGLVLATMATLDRLTVTVADDQVTFTRGGVDLAVKRPLVCAVFLDGKQLVLLGRATEELAREASDLEADRLRDAFVLHGFPWRRTATRIGTSTSAGSTASPACRPAPTRCSRRAPGRWTRATATRWPSCAPTWPGWT